MGDPVSVLDGDVEVASDGHAQLLLQKDVGIDGAWGITAKDGGGFTCVIMNDAAWAEMKAKVDKWIRSRSESTTEGKVKDLLVEYLGCSDEMGRNNKSHLEHDLGADSLDIVELATQLEEAFDISLPDEEWDKWWEKDCTVGGIVKLVEGKVKS